METYLSHFIAHSTTYAVITIILVAFLESLAIVGLMLPGTVMMASLGALIGTGKIDFFVAWAAGVIGCLLGDWSSYALGFFFKKPLHNWKFLRRYKNLMDKIEHALDRHNMLAVLLGRLIGPTRPLLPMIAGMLNLSPHRFAVPNLIGCIIWPPIYFFPGILIGIAVKIPNNVASIHFKWLLILFFVLLWAVLILLWQSYRRYRNVATIQHKITSMQLNFLNFLVVTGLLIVGFFLVHNTLFDVYWQILVKVFRH